MNGILVINKTEENKVKLLLSDYIRIDGKIWFSAVNYNGLFQYVPETKHTKLIACFNNDEPGKSFLHSKMLKHNSSIWLIPFQAKNIYEYNTSDRVLNCFAIPKVDEEAKCSFFLEGEVIGDKLYLFPCRYKGIIVFNLNMKKVERIIKLDDSEKNGTALYAFKGAKIFNNKIYIANIKKNRYQVIDLISNCKEVVTLNDDFGGITHLFVTDKNVIVVGYNGKIGVYDIHGEKKYISQFESRINGPKFYDACINKEMLFLTENDKSRIAIYNYETNQKREKEYPISDKKVFEEFWANVLFLKFEFDKIIFQNVFDGCIYSLENNKIRNLGDIVWNITNEERKKIKFNNIVIVKEHYGYELKTFLNNFL